MILKVYGFHILKRCGEELKTAVNYMDVDDVNIEVGCNKVFRNTLYLRCDLERKRTKLRIIKGNKIKDTKGMILC